MFWLGAAAPEIELPSALAFWRDVGRAFVARLCAVPDIEKVRGAAKVEMAAEELDVLAAVAPPMVGGEYLTATVLANLCERMGEAFRADIGAWDETVEGFLRQASPAWNLVGRVCFHLAENKHDEEAPFAFVATYTTRMSAQAKVQHLPLGQALREYAGARNRSVLLALLTPVQRAAVVSQVAKALVDSGDVFETLAWTPEEAHSFLKEVPLLESAGVVVRTPASWHTKRPPRPEVQVTLGKARKGGVDADALMDFSMAVTLEGEDLTPRELRDLLAGTDGMALVRGRWIELDREKLQRVLDHWKAFASRVDGGMSVVDGLRLLAGAPIGDDSTAAHGAEIADWSKVVAGPALARALTGLRSPEGLAEVNPGGALLAELRPYQKVGLRWLWWLKSLGLGGCLADDMGLGKTLQVIALFTLIKKKEAGLPNLLVVPASLIANWRAEIARFAPGLNVLVAHPSELSSAELGGLSSARIDGSDVVITSYGTVQRVPWFAERSWNVVVADEAQAIKNPGAKQTRAVKALRGRTRLALTGTPVENRLGDLWSIFDFICPGLLGTPKAFTRFTKAADARPHNGYGPLRDLVRPYILRRLKTDKSVIADLPDKTEVRAFCGLTKKQGALYQQTVDDLGVALRAVDGIKRRGIVLAALMRLKQICNHPSQWLSDGVYASGDSGKFARLTEICDEIASRQEKVLVFTQFRELDAAAGQLSGHRVREAGPGSVRRDAGEEADGVGQSVPARGWATFLRSVVEGGRDGAQPDGGDARHSFRSVVESGGRKPGHRSCLSHRPEAECPGPQIRLPRHGRGEDRQADRVQAGSRPASARGDR